MQSIDGRVDDWLVMPSGKLFEPARVLCVCSKTVLQNPSLFDQYRIVHKRRDLLVFQYVKGNNFDARNLDTIIKDLKALFDEPLNVLAEEVPPEHKPKRRALQSLVPHGRMF